RRVFLVEWSGGAFDLCQLRSCAGEMGGSRKLERLVAVKSDKPEINMVVDRTRLALLQIGKGNLAIGDFQILQREFPPLLRLLRLGCRLRLGSSIRGRRFRRGLSLRRGRLSQGRKIPLALLIFDELNFW